jgi:hypothetical protein
VETRVVSRVPTHTDGGPIGAGIGAGEPAVGSAGGPDTETASDRADGARERGGSMTMPGHARIAAIATAVLLSAALLSSCGGHPAITRDASAQLTAAVARVRAAAVAHDTATASARLDDVRKSVLLLRANGELSQAAAGRILSAADLVASDLPLASTTTTTTTPTSPSTSTTTSTVPAPRGKDHHGKDHQGD